MPFISSLFITKTELARNITANINCTRTDAVSCRNLKSNFRYLMSSTSPSLNGPSKIDFKMTAYTLTNRRKKKVCNKRTRQYQLYIWSSDARLTYFNCDWISYVYDNNDTCIEDFRRCQYSGPCKVNALIDSWQCRYLFYADGLSVTMRPSKL